MMPDAGSPYLNRPVRPLQEFLEGQQRLAEQRRYAEIISILENLYWAVENNCAQGDLWNMRHELGAARDQIRKAKIS